MTKNISSLDTDQLTEHLKNGLLKICVVGIGRIGLPTALSFAKSGLQTIGVDINTELVNMINSGEYTLKDEPEFDKVFEDVINQKKFSAITDLSKAVPGCDVVLLSLPTPMDDQNVPDYSALLSVGKNLNGLLSHGQLVIVESTVEPGFIENELLHTIEGPERNLKSGIDFHLAVCPETANPGEIMNDFKKLPRLVASIDEKISTIVSKIYTHVFNVELIAMPNCKTANAVKLTTNVFRDINIAFINELSMLFEKLGIDAYTVIEAAKRKYNFQPHYPSSGVGGPCLPINSYQLLNTEKKLGGDFLNIIRAARNTNEYMSEHVVKLLTDALNQINVDLNGATITLLGVSYKPNVNDVQIAPSKEIIDILQKSDTKIKIFDPYFKSTTVFSYKTESNFDEAVSDADAVILITAHDEFRDIDLSKLTRLMKNPVIVDCQGVIIPEEAKKAGLIFRGIGRGEF